MYGGATMALGEGCRCKIYVHSDMSGSISGELKSINLSDNPNPLCIATTTMSPVELPLYSMDGSMTSSPSHSASTVSLSGLAGAGAVRKLRFDDRSQTLVSLALRSNAASKNIEPVSRREADVLAPLVPLNHIKWLPVASLSQVISSSDFIQRFGTPQTFEVSTVYMAIATDKGHVIGFNYRQSIEFALQTAPDITYLSFSSDSTHLAAGHSSGRISIWDLSTAATTVTTGADSIAAVSTLPTHTIATSMTGHDGLSAINSVGFVAAYHSQLFSSDSNGTVCYHHGIKQVLRKHFVSQRVLSRAKSSIMACELLPLGSSEQITDSIGLVSVMTGNTLLVCSFLSLDNQHIVKVREHHTARRKKNGSTSAMASTATLAWYPCMQIPNTLHVENAKLAYAWDNQLYILELQNDTLPQNFLAVLSDLKDKDKALPTLAMTKTSTWTNPQGSISAVNWISSKLVCVTCNNVMTTLHYSGTKLTVVGEDTTMGITPITVRNSRDRLLVLGDDHSVILGSLVNWADTLVHLLSQGDHLSALARATEFYNSTDSCLLEVNGLPILAPVRKPLVKRHLLDIMTISINYLFQQRGNAATSLKLYFDIFCDLRRDDPTEVSMVTMPVLDAIFEQFQDEDVFFDTLEPYLLRGSIDVLSPTVLQALVSYYARMERGYILTEILCVLDIRLLDIDLTMQLCRKYNLRDALVYIWNYLLQDYETPFVEYINDIRVGALDSVSCGVFTYMSYILTGRQYPTDRLIGLEMELKARKSICKYLFSNTIVDGALTTDNDSIFPYLLMFLRFDSFEMLSTLNEFFEDTVLNDNEGILLNRQYIIEALLDIFDTHSQEFNTRDRCQLGIFIARNYPKYSQFIRLSDSTLDGIIDDLCSNTDDDILDDCQLALQSLISEYEPEIDPVLIAKIQAAKFYDVLMGIYRTEMRYSNVLESWLQKMASHNDGKSMGKVLEDCFNGCKRNSSERHNLVNVVRDNFLTLLAIDSRSLVRLVELNCPSVHGEILRVEHKTELLASYIEELLRVVDIEKINGQIIHKYVEVLLQEKDRDISKLLLFVKRLAVTKVGVVLSDVEKLLSDADCIDGSTILFMEESRYEEALDGVLKRMTSLGDVPEVEKYGMLAMDICDSQEPQNFDGELYLNERMWLRLIDTCVEIAHGESSTRINGLLQTCFKRVSTKKDTLNSQDRSVFAIFNKFLERIGEDKKIAVATLSNVRGILHEVFVSYSYESEMLKICLRLLHSGINKSMKVIRSQALRGMDIRQKNCTSCGKAMWGNDISEDHWLAWEDRLRETIHVNLEVDINGKYRHCGLIFFACGHGYHQPCFDGLGGGEVCVLENLS